MSYIEVINAETVKFIQKSGELILQFRDFERNIYKIQSNSENVSSMDSSFGLSYHIFFGIIRNHTQGIQSWVLPDKKELTIEIYGGQRQSENEKNTNANSKGATPDVKMEEWKFVFRNLEEQESMQGNITRVINPQQFCMNLSILMRSIMALLVNTPLFKQRDQLKISRRIHFSKETVRPFSPQLPLRLAHYSKTIYLLHHVFEFTLSYATDQPISTPSSWEQPHVANFSSDSPSFSFGSFSLSNNQPQSTPQQQSQNAQKQKELLEQAEQKQLNINEQNNLPLPPPLPPNISSFSVYSQIESSLSPTLKKRDSNKKCHTELDIPAINTPNIFQKQQPDMMLFQTDPKNNLPQDQKLSEPIPAASVLKLSSLTNNQNSILRMEFSSVSSVGSPVSQVETSQSEIMSLPKSILSSPSKYPIKAPKKYSEDLTGQRKFKDRDESPKFQGIPGKDSQTQDNEEKKESSFLSQFLSKQERERAQTVGIQQSEENQKFETKKEGVSQTNTLQESILQFLSQLEQVGDPFLDKKKNTMLDVINSLL